MPDEITPKVEDKPVIKSWDAMRKEAKAKQREKIIKKFTKEVKVEETPKIEAETEKNLQKEVENSEKQEPKVEEPKIDIEAVTKKAAEESASKVAEEVKQAFSDKVQQILDKDKSLIEKQKELDELIPVYLKENRLPKDYKEMVDEQLRVTEARWQQLEREKEAKVKAETPKIEEPKVDPAKLALENYQKEIQADLEDLYTAKFLPRPSKIDEINNPATQDEAAQATQKLFEFGVKLNTERVAKGLPPVKSLSKIYFLHYKPTMGSQPKKSDQPAGADAPISPSRNQSVTEVNKPTPFYQKGPDGRLHAKSSAQIKYEALKSRIGK